MNSDDERPIDLQGLDEVPVPDQWDEIVTRAAAVGPSPGGLRPLLAAAAALVVVLVGVGLWLAADGDGDGNLLGPADGDAVLVDGGQDPSGTTEAGPDDPAGVWDRSWALTEISRDGRPLEIPPGEFRIHLRGGFSAAGEPTPPGMWMFRGCNQGSGSLTLEGDLLLSVASGQEDMGCLDVRLHELDSAVGLLLREGARVELRGDDLTLTSTTVVGRFSAPEPIELPVSEPSSSADEPFVGEDLSEEHRALLERYEGQVEFVYRAVVEEFWTEPLDQPEGDTSPARGRLMARLRVTEDFEGGLAVGSVTTIWYGTELADGTPGLPDLVSQPAVVGDRVLVMAQTSADPAARGIQVPALDGIGLLSLESKGPGSDSGS